MELGVRMIDLPTVTTGPDVAGLTVAGVCAAVFLAFGVAHYRGAFRRLVDPWLISPYTGLAAAWLGSGGLLVVGSLALPPAGVAADLAAVLLGLLGLAAWVVGLVGIVWLPTALRPRWLRALLADPQFQARNRGRRRREPDHDRPHHRSRP